jgi:hypothetical protein
MRVLIGFLVLFMLTNHAKFMQKLCCAQDDHLYIRPAHTHGSRSMRIPWIVAAVGPGPRVVLRLQVHPPHRRCLLTVGEQRLSSDRLLRRRRQPHLQPVFPRQQQPPISGCRRCKDEETQGKDRQRGLRGRGPAGETNSSIKSYKPWTRKRKERTASSSRMAGRGTFLVVILVEDTLLKRSEIS